MITSKICEIELNNEQSWKNKIFITFDVEWVSDFVLAHVLDLLEKAKVKATFFATHPTSLLEKIQANELFDLGLHPNFNFLLEGDFRYGKNYQEVVDYYLAIVPTAVSFRSHALTQNTLILNYCKQKGLSHESNLLLPYLTGINATPYQCNATKLVRAPFVWDDYTTCLNKATFDLHAVLETTGIKVFNFHPLHVFLNSCNLDVYEVSKQNQHDKDKLSAFTNKSSYGVYNFLAELLAYCQELEK